MDMAGPPPMAFSFEMLAAGENRGAGAGGFDHGRATARFSERIVHMDCDFSL